MAKVSEFASMATYQRWLAQHGERIKIVNVSTTKRWSLWTGFLGDAKTYTVTYEDVPPDQAAREPGRRS